MAGIGEIGGAAEEDRDLNVGGEKPLNCPGDLRRLIICSRCRVGWWLTASLARTADEVRSAQERARAVLPHIWQAQRAGATTLVAIAEALTARGIASCPVGAGGIRQRSGG